MTPNQIEKRVRQRNALTDFLAKHGGEYYLQINFCAPCSPDHVCVGIPHEDVEAFHQLVIQSLGK